MKISNIRYKPIVKKNSLHRKIEFFLLLNFFSTNSFFCIKKKRIIFSKKHWVETEITPFAYQAMLFPMSYPYKKIHSVFSSRVLTWYSIRSEWIILPWNSGLLISIPSHQLLNQPSKVPWYEEFWLKCKDFVTNSALPYNNKKAVKKFDGVALILPLSPAIHISKWPGEQPMDFSGYAFDHDSQVALWKRVKCK